MNTEENNVEKSPFGRDSISFALSPQVQPAHNQHSEIQKNNYLCKKSKQ
ncbi:MAG: hypothetical protein LBT56_04725 [Prevotellaceae bacterium]|nr:hypothetical protein [Prevotellaceae bacterium]